MKYVSIHAPRAERDRLTISEMVETLSFNPRAPGGARQAACFKSYCLDKVSIHAPRAERDDNQRIGCAKPIWFQSTRPGRSAT